MSQEDRKIDRHFVKCIAYGHYTAGLNAYKSYQLMTSIPCRKAPSRTQVYTWFTEFKAGLVNFTDAERSGRPTTKSTPENIKTIKDLIDSDKSLSLRDLEGLTGINYVVIHSMIRDHLHFRKDKDIWVPTTKSGSVKRKKGVKRSHGQRES